MEEVLAKYNHPTWLQGDRVSRWVSGRLENTQGHRQISVQYGL